MRPGTPATGPCRLGEAERRVFSQHGLDGVLERVFECAGTDSRLFIEIGTQAAMQCSTRHLRVRHAFRGYMFDDGHEDCRIGLKKTFVDPGEVVGLVTSTLAEGDPQRSVPATTPAHLDLLAIDTDGGDFRLWQSLCNGGVRPRVVVLEVALRESRRGMVPLPLMESLSRSCGYSLVHTVCNDAVFVRADVVAAAAERGSPFIRVGDLAWHLSREERRLQATEALEKDRASFFNAGLQGRTFESLSAIDPDAEHLHNGVLSHEG